MTTIEDILVGLEHLNTRRVITNQWQQSFINNLNHLINTGNALSTNQVDATVKIAKAVIKPLSLAMNLTHSQLMHSCDNIISRRPLYTSVSVKREVRYVGKGILAFRAKWDPTIKYDMNKLKVISNHINESITFNNKNRIWLVPVSSENIIQIQALITKHRFDFDDEALKYIQACKKISTRTVDVPSQASIINDDIVIHIDDDPMLVSILLTDLRATYQ